MTLRICALVPVLVQLKILSNFIFFMLMKPFGIIEVFLICVGLNQLYRNSVCGFSYTVIPEPTALSPGRGLLIPLGYLRPGKCEHSEVQSQRSICLCLVNARQDCLFIISK